MPATSTVLIAFFSSFLLQPLTVLMKQTRQPVRTVKQSIYLDVMGITLYSEFHKSVVKYKLFAIVNCGFALKVSVMISRVINYDHNEA